MQADANVTVLMLNLTISIGFNCAMSSCSTSAQKKSQKYLRMKRTMLISPFPDESEIESFSRSNKGRFSGLSLISNPETKEIKPNLNPQTLALLRLVAKKNVEKQTAGKFKILLCM